MAWWQLFGFPIAVAHEATHYAIARLGTDDAQFAAEVTGGRARARWPPLQSRVLRFFAFLGPTVFGSLLASIWLVSGASLGGWRLILLVGLAMYTMPSPADVRGAVGRQDAQQNHDSSSTHADRPGA